MNRPRTVIRFINAAHVIDHMFMLIFPAAVLGMAGSFDLDYAGLIGLSLGGFDRGIRRDLPPGRHRDAGGTRGEPRPRDRHQRHVG